MRVLFLLLWLLASLFTVGAGLSNHASESQTPQGAVESAGPAESTRMDELSARTEPLASDKQAAASDADARVIVLKKPIPEVLQSR